MKFLDKRGERRAQQAHAKLLADKGLLDAWVKNRAADLQHDTASAANVEWEGFWGRSVLVARSMVRPAAFYAVTSLFGAAVVGNLCWGVEMDAALLGMLHESLGLVLGFYFTGRNSERLLGVG